MKKSKRSLIILQILLAIIFSGQVFSQIYPYTVWKNIYNGPANLQDSSVAICMNPLGMVFVTGWSLGSSTNKDIVTIRHNPSDGIPMWTKILSSNVAEEPSSMTCDNIAVYVTGNTFFPGPTRDVVTIKYNALTGDTMWVKRHNGPFGGGDYGLAITNDANFVYVCGRAAEGPPERQRYMVLKYDIITGAMASGFPFIYTADTLNNEAHAICVDNLGSIYVTGQTSFNKLTSPWLSVVNILTLKISSTGTLVWAKTHNASGNGIDNGVSIGLDNTQANLFVAGWGQKSAFNDFIVIKYNSSTGDSIGYASYNGPTNGTDFLIRMAIDAGNNVYVTGNSLNSPLNRYEIATLKYNSSLVQQWAKRTTNADGWDLVNWITVGTNNDVFIEGSRVKAGQGFNFYTVRYNAATGDTIWTIMENGTANGNDYGSGVVCSDSQRVYITGSAIYSPASFSSILTARYASEIIGIKTISNEVPQNFELYQNYPNPFNPATFISFDIPKASAVNLVVYDAAGRVVEVIADNVNLPSGKYEAAWDASKYASGIYFYRLQAGSFTDTKKMILVK